MEIIVVVQVWLSSNTIWDWYCWTRTAPGGSCQVNLQIISGSYFYVKTCSMGNDVTLMDKWYRKDTNKVRERECFWWQKGMNMQMHSCSWKPGKDHQSSGVAIVIPPTLCSAAVVHWRELDHLITALWQTWQGEPAPGIHLERWQKKKMTGEAHARPRGKDRLGRQNEN